MNVLPTKPKPGQIFQNGSSFFLYRDDRLGWESIDHRLAQLGAAALESFATRSIDLPSYAIGKRAKLGNWSTEARAMLEIFDRACELGLVKAAKQQEK